VTDTDDTPALAASDGAERANTYTYRAGQLTTDALGREVSVDYAGHGREKRHVDDVLVRVTHDAAGTTELWFRATTWQRVVGLGLFNTDRTVPCGLTIPSDQLVTVHHP